MDAAADLPRATRREWIGLCVLALPCVLYSMDLTVLNLAVPKLAAQLRPGSMQLLWILDVHGFVLAGTLVPMGTLGDRIGRRRLLLSGAAAFGVASALAAFATSAGMLIAARAILGLAAATLAPSSLSLIRGMFRNPAERTVAVGVWIASFSAGTAIGPLAGGFLLERFWWGSVFLAGTPVMLLLLVLGPFLLPEFRDPHPGPLDPISAALSLVAIFAAVYGLERMVEGGAPLLPALSVCAGAGTGFVFVRRQARLPHPLVDLRLFRAPAFNAALATYALSAFVGLGIFVFTSQYLQWVLGFSPLRAGLFTAPSALALIAGSLLTPIVARRVRPRVVVAAALAVAAAGFALLGRLQAGSSLALFVAGEVVDSLGLAAVFTLAADLIVGSAPADRAGAAAALSETGSELGGALGIAVLGSIFAVVYRAGMARAGSDAAIAGDTLGAALRIAKDLPGPAGAALLHAAREAFVSSLRVVCGIAAIISLGMSTVALLFLGRQGTDGSPRNQTRLAAVPAPARGFEVDMAMGGSKAGGRSGTERAAWAVLPLRLMIGFGFAAHGYAKLSRGPASFAAIVAALGFPAPLFTAWATSVLEFAGGIFLMMGAFVAPLSIPLSAIMATAMFGVHFRYGFSSIRLKALTAAGAEFGPVGYELSLVYLVGLATLALAGSGPLSIDRWLESRRRQFAASSISQ